jgi:hypothetical protein
MSTAAPGVREGGADRLRLYACQRYLRWTVERAQEWKTDHRPAEADLIMLSIFCRSTRTYEAVVRWLGQQLYSEQALMLNRALFEDMVDIHWVSLNPDLAFERLIQHDKYSRLLRADVQRKWPDFFEGRKPPPIRVTNEERKELKSLFGGSGSKGWTGEPNIEDRLEGILKCWPDEDARRVVRFWHEWVDKINNETLHPSAFFIGRLVEPQVDEDGEGMSITWRFGSTPEWITQALHGALWSYGQTVGLIVKHFGIATTEDHASESKQAQWSFDQAQHWESTGTLESVPKP